jgi:hypothetical protein
MNPWYAVKPAQAAPRESAATVLVRLMQGLTEKNTIRWFCAAGLRVRVEIFLHPTGINGRRSVPLQLPNQRTVILLWLVVVNANYYSFSLLTGKGSKILPSLINQ